MQKKRLYKSDTDRKLDGICGGIADYLNMDSTIIRLAWIFFICLGGSGIIAYILCMLIIPRDPYPRKG